MARGPSGRIVVEIDPSLKRELHGALATDGLTLKQWFLSQAEQYLRDYRQPELPLVGEAIAAYESTSSSERNNE